MIKRQLSCIVLALAVTLLLSATPAYASHTVTTTDTIPPSVNVGERVMIQFESSSGPTGNGVAEWRNFPNNICFEPQHQDDYSLNQDGLFDFNATADFAGLSCVFEVIYEAGTGDSDGVPFTIEIPAIRPYNVNFGEGDPFPPLSDFVDYVPTDPTTVSYTITNLNLPDGIEFDDSTGNFIGDVSHLTIRSGNSFSDFAFTWTYTADGNTYTQSTGNFLFIRNTNSPPTLATIPTADQLMFDEGDIVSFTITALDDDTNDNFGRWILASPLPGGLVHSNGTFSGTLTSLASGTYPVDISYRDTSGDTSEGGPTSGTVSTDLTIVVNDIPLVDDLSVREGDTVDIPLGVVGSPTITCTTGSDIPSDLEFNGDTCTITGNVNSDAITNGETSQEFIIDYTLTSGDGRRNGMGTYTLIVISADAIGSAPTIDSVTPFNPTYDEGQLVEITLMGSDPDGDSLMWALSPNTPGAALNTTTGGVTQFSWTPDDTQDGPHTFNVILTDSVGQESDPEVITFTVNEVNAEPSLSGTLYNEEYDEGDTISDSLAVTITDAIEDPPSPMITYTLETGQTPPPGIMLHPNGTLSGTISHDAVSAGAMPQNLTFTWTYNDDGIGPNANITQTSSITVTDVPIVVAPDDGASTHTEGDRVDRSLGVTGDGDITCTSTSTIPGSLTLNPACTITGNLDRNVITNSLASQEFTINYMARNPDDVSDSGTYVLTVNDRPPTFDAYDRTVEEGQPLDSLYDAVADSARTPASTIFSYEIIPGSLPSGITDLFDMTTGEFNGSIPFDIVTLAEGSQTFNFQWRFTDTIGVSGVQDGVLIVDNFNQAPTITGTDPATIDDTPDEHARVQFTLTGGDEDGNDPDPIWDVSSDNSAATANATITQSGEFQWTPDDTHGDTTVTFTFTLIDTEPLSADPRIIAFDVQEVNIPPTIGTYNFTISEGLPINPLSEVVDNPVEIPPDAINTYAIIDGPGNNLTSTIRSSLNVNTGAFSAMFPAGTVPDGAPHVRYDFDWTFEDELGASDPPLAATIFVTGSGTNLDPVIGDLPDLQDRTIEEHDTLTFTLSNVDPNTGDRDSGIWTMPNTLGATMGRTTGVFEWTPDDTHNGMHTFTVTLTDPGGLEGTAEIVVTVTEFNARPTPSGTTYEVRVNEGGNLDSNPLTGLVDDMLENPPSTIRYTIDIGQILPPGIRLNLNGTFSGTVSHDIANLANSPQPFPFTWNYNDGDHDLPGSGIIMVINDNRIPTVGPIPGDVDRTPDEGQLVQFIMPGSDEDFDTGDPRPTWRITTSSDTNARIDTTSGEFTWTPDDTHGNSTISFNFILEDSASRAGQLMINFDVQEFNAPPTDSRPYTVTVSEGGEITTSLVGSVDDIPENPSSDVEYTTSDTLPSGITLNRNGTFSGTVSHTVATAGNSPQMFEFEWTYDDDEGGSNININQMGTITVNNDNRPPTIDPPTDTIIPIAEFAPATLSLTRTDPDVAAGDDRPVWGVTANSTTNGDIDADGLFTWTPDDSHGSTTVTFTFTLMDSAGASALPEDVSYVVSEVNLEPTSTLYFSRVNEGDSIDLPLTSSITDEPEDPPSTITYTTSDTLPPGIRLNPDGTFTGTVSLDATILADSPQNFTFNWRYSDGDNNADETGIIEVTNVNQSPEIIVHTIEVTSPDRPPVTVMPENIGSLPNLPIGDTLTINFTARDADPNTDFVWVLTTSDPRESLTADGLYTFTPDRTQENLNTGRTVTLSDGIIDTPISQAIRVFVIGSVPMITISPDPPDHAAIGSPVTFTVTARDPDRNPITSLDILSNTVGATLTNGQFSWTPTADHVGPNVFTFRAIDERLGTGTATHTITVPTGENEPPTFVTYEPAILEGQMIPSLSDAVDDPFESDQPPVEYRIMDGDLPDYIEGSLNAQTGAFDETFRFDTTTDSMTFFFSWTFRDGSGEPKLQLGSITVNNDPDLIPTLTRGNDGYIIGSYQPTVLAMEMLPPLSRVVTDYPVEPPVIPTYTIENPGNLPASVANSLNRNTGAFSAMFACNVTNIGIDVVYTFDWTFDDGTEPSGLQRGTITMQSGIDACFTETNEAPTITRYTENAEIGTTILPSLSTVVTDTSENPVDAAIAYAITGGNLPDYIADFLDEDTGDFSVPFRCGFADSQTFTFTWTYTDGSGTYTQSDARATAVFNAACVTLTSINEEPTFSTSAYFPRISERAPIPSLSTIVTDPIEDPPDTTISYSFVDGTSELPQIIMDSLDSSTGDFGETFPCQTTRPGTSTIPSFSFNWIYTDNNGRESGTRSGTIAVEDDPNCVNPVPLFTTVNEDPIVGIYNNGVSEGKTIPSLSVAVFDPPESSIDDAIAYAITGGALLDNPAYTYIVRSLDTTTGDFGAVFNCGTLENGQTDLGFTWTYTDETDTYTAPPSVITVNNDNNCLTSDNEEATITQYRETVNEGERIPPLSRDVMNPRENPPDVPTYKITTRVDPEDVEADLPEYIADSLNPRTGAFDTVFRCDEIETIQGNRFGFGWTYSDNVNPVSLEQAGSIRVEPNDQCSESFTPENEPPTVRNYIETVRPGGFITSLSTAVTDPEEQDPDRNIRYQIKNMGNLPESIARSLDEQTGDFSTQFTNTFLVDGSSNSFVFTWSYQDSTGESEPRTASLMLAENSGGSSNNWKKKPTFGQSWEISSSQLVTDGFTFNGHTLDITDNWHTDFTRTSSIIGETNSVNMKAYAADGFSYVTLSLGVPEIGEVSDAETDIILMLSRNYTSPVDYDITEIIHEQKESLVDESQTTAAVNKVKCNPGSDVQCYSFDIDFKVNAPLKSDVLAISAVDSKRRSTVTYVNEGVEFTGQSLLAPNTHYIVQKKTNQGPAEMLTLTQQDRRYNIWEDDSGYLWAQNDHGSWFSITTPESERFVDGAVNVMTRMHSNFEKLMQQEQDRATVIFNASKLVSVPDQTFSYDYSGISYGVSKMDKLADELDVEQGKAERIMELLR